MQTPWKVALVLCLYLAFFDLFGRILGPSKDLDAVLAALAATTIAAGILSGFAKKLTLK